MLLATYGYDGLSRKTGLTYLNSAGATYAYQADSAVQTISQGFLGTLSDVSYTFDYNKANQVTNRNISNLAYVFDGFEDEGSTDYTANGLNKYTLTEAAPPPPAGQSNPAPETVVATSYTYDANGSLTSTGRWDYAYDAENRLIQAHDTVDNVMVRYHYDGKGRRVAKWVDDSYSGSFVAQKRYEYLYEGDEPIQDYVEIADLFIITHRYLHGSSVDERLVHWSYDQNTGLETAEQFYHRDHQGSIVAMSDASGDRVTGELYTYDAYGNMGLGNTDGQPFRYTGRRWDDETGLYYYRARYYSAKLGRFLQTDPIGYEDNMNMYGYVGNDPVNSLDPSGTACIPLVNNYSPFCRRSRMFGELHSIPSIAAQTTFFGAASIVTAGLASKDLPLARRFVSEKTSAFLDVVSTKLQGENTLRGASLASGHQSLGSRLANDRAFVRFEQKLVQNELDALRATDPTGFATIISEINALLNPESGSKEAFATSLLDPELNAALNTVRETLGRDIDFSNKNDRILIGDTLTDSLRGDDDEDTPFCTGSKIKREGC